MVRLFALPVVLALALGGGATQFESDFAAHAHGANQSLLWGAYRPNLYFGLRPRIPNSLMHGLMWFGTHDYTSYTSASTPRAHPRAPELMTATSVQK